MTVDAPAGHFIAAANDEDYEGAIPKIEKQLLSGWFLKTCFNCQYSDYHVAGTMAFGSMYCFASPSALLFVFTPRNGAIPPFPAGKKDSLTPR